MKMSSQLGAINTLNSLISKVFKQPKGDLVRKREREREREREKKKRPDQHLCSFRPTV